MTSSEWKSETETPPVALWIPHWIYDGMIAHCLRDAPMEACGLLGGRNGRATSIHPLRNAEASETRFFADTGDLRTAYQSMRKFQEELTAIYHSHPRWAAVPSRRDLEQNANGSVPAIIISLLEDPPDLRVWRLDPDGYAPLGWSITEESPPKNAGDST